jgi:hypothetical protein
MRLALFRTALIAASALVAWRIVAVNAFVYDPSGHIRTGSGDGRSEFAARLDANPADVASLLALAFRSRQDGQPAAAGAQLAAARGIAPREQAVLGMQVGELAEQGRLDDAAQVLSQLTSSFDAHARTFPVFARLLEAQHPAFLALAARNPSWLGHFILDQCGRNADPRLLAPLLQARGRPAAGALPLERECVIERLRGAGEWAAAYQLWLNALPAARLANVGFVFNGSFEEPPSGSGFDWRPNRAPERESGHSVEFAASRDAADGRVLRVAYNGKRQSSAAISEYLAAPPGRYRLQGRARIDAMNSARGVQWVVRCAGDGRQVAASERFLGSRGWGEFAFDVDIPVACAGQVLQLEAVGVEQGTTFLSGVAWFDDLVLTLRR